ncbi:MAG: hypothetical protein ACR2GP_00040 [Burkholderiaceae bacterium]
MTHAAGDDAGYRGQALRATAGQRAAQHERHVEPGQHDDAEDQCEEQREVRVVGHGGFIVEVIAD